MNCFDCVTSSASTAAVAVCSTCGVGVCEQHARIGSRHVETHSMGNPSSAVLPGRRIFCSVCAPAGATAAAAAPPAESVVSATI
ncbi:DUF2180 family protein [Luteimicrobium sp. DT211]|uniref:DUF2180 family protein n=1 Tax=Luteimicrobium sp. DT211 TaxID=3393412 RepID=UPI003CED2F74